VVTCEHVVRGAGSEPITLGWQGQEGFAQAELVRVLPAYDLALLRFSPPEHVDLPWVWLDADLRVGDRLYTFGYPERDYDQGRPATVEMEGFLEGRFLLLKQGQLQPGMSGGPLLNLRTGRVCAMAKFTRDQHTDLGGGGVQGRVILEQLPELGEGQAAFSRGDRRWPGLPELSQNSPGPGGQTVLGGHATQVNQPIGPTFTGPMTGNTIHIYPPGSSSGGDRPDPDPEVFLVSMAANPFFTGRETLLTDIHRTLGKWRKAAIYGLGGLGKTETARAYVERHRADYRQVFWVRASTLEEVFLGYSDMARALALPEADQPNQPAIAAAVKGWLESPDHHRWLLVIDNADDLKTLQPHLPLQGMGHLLFTTRAHAPGPIAQGLEVTKMGPEEGATFLLRRARRIEPGAELTAATAADQDLARQLVMATDGLPLALDQAGAFIEDRDDSLGEYLGLFETEKAALLQERGELAGDHPSVWVTFSLAFAKVAEANPASADLVRVCAFLAPDAIPEELFHQGAAMLGDCLGALADQPLQRTKAMGEASRFSLISRNPDTQTLSIHRLVQTVVRAELDADSQRQWAERVVNGVTEVFPNADYENWGACDRLISQALAAIQLVVDYGIKTETSALLLNQTGYYFHQKGLYSEAEPLYQQALELYQELLGKRHPQVATSLNNLALLYANQGRYEAAEPLYQQALELYQELLGKRHPQVALSLNNLTALYANQGRYDEAEPLHQQALELWRELLGERHPDVATSLNNLARLYDSQGRYDEAEPLYQQALELNRELLGDRHPDVAQSLNNLAELYRAQGRYAEAEPLYHQALELRRELLGDLHPDVAQSLNNLAELYRAQGRYAEAEPLYHQALELRRELLGDRHPQVAGSLFNLGGLRYNQGRYPEALDLFLEAEAIFLNTLGADHPHTQALQSWLAVTRAALEE
jgi:tetratricopeptide (TPR) repeat protein